MSMIAWLTVGAVVAGISLLSGRFAFPAGRPACLLGGIAGGFLGGGTLTVAAGASRVGVYSAAAAAVGALVVVTAVGWAGGGEARPPQGGPRGQHDSMVEIGQPDDGFPP